jgi:hypothetical protein
MTEMLETNVFEITNLNELKSNYKLYRIRGLSKDQDEYDQNKQILIRKLSYELNSPATIIERDEGPYLVLRQDSLEPQSPYTLVRTVAYFDLTDKMLDLDFENPTDETITICQRFLQFGLNGGLHNHQDVWQPSAGQPFFYRKPVKQERGVDIFRGASIRIIVLSGNKLAICFDIKHKYVSQKPLPTHLTSSEFRRLKGLRCVYHWGSRWYDIKLQDLSDLKVNEYQINRSPTEHNLLKADIMRHGPKPLTREVADLADDGSVVIYKSGKDEPKGAPSALCYPSFETNDARIRQFHNFTILRPDVRRMEIQKFIDIIKNSLTFWDTKVKIKEKPLQIPRNAFITPDFAFGHNFVLSVRGSKDARHVSLNELGKARLKALFDSEIGPYSTEPLDKQYLIWPKSVAQSYGSAFLMDLKSKVNQLYPSEVPYEPELIEYNDDGARTFANQGKAILEAVQSRPYTPGYGIVVLHDDSTRKNRQEDQLASMIMQELRKKSLFISVIHTTVASRSYVLPPNSPRGVLYRRTNDTALLGKLDGYLRNVAISKILLTNEKWPFVLATPLNFDLTIGIDVKHHTACFSFIDKTGSNVRTEIRHSNQKEKLSKEQVKSILIEILREEFSFGQKIINSIVFHRDGRFFDTEIRGIKAAIKILQSECAFSGEVNVNFAEIAKSSPAPIRFFGVIHKSFDNDFVENPEIGDYWFQSGHDAYLCSTGRAFRKRGTVNPLHVKYIEGNQSFEQILEDLYFLTCLTWTRPEDCTRYPLTIKLADIRLREHAGEYNADLLEYGEDDEDDGEMTENE